MWNSSILNVQSYYFGRISVKCCKHLSTKSVQLRKCEWIKGMCSQMHVKLATQLVCSECSCFGEPLFGKPCCTVQSCDTHFLQEDCPGRRCRRSNRTRPPGLDAAWTERTPPPHCCERMRCTRHTAYHLQKQTGFSQY